MFVEKNDLYSQSALIVDIGGTYIRKAIVNKHNFALKQVEKSESNFRSLFDEITRYLVEVNLKPQRCFIAIPAFLKNGLIYSGDLPQIRGPIEHLSRELSSIFECIVFMNDFYVAASGVICIPLEETILLSKASNNYSSLERWNQCSIVAGCGTGYGQATIFQKTQTDHFIRCSESGYESSPRNWLKYLSEDMLKNFEIARELLCGSGFVKLVSLFLKNQSMFSRSEEILNKIKNSREIYVAASSFLRCLGAKLGGAALSLTSEKVYLIGSFVNAIFSALPNAKHYFMEGFLLASHSDGADFLAKCEVYLVKTHDIGLVGLANIARYYSSDRQVLWLK